MISDYDSLYEKIGYRFHDTKLLELALTHRSAGGKNNERLEFLGDGVLNFIVAGELYHHFPDAKEGELSRLRAILVKKETLAALAGDLDFGSYLRLGSGEMKSGGFRRESILANAVEALVGAIYLDSGFSACQTCVNQWYAPRLASNTVMVARKDPKTQLQELLQAKQLPLPEYTVLSVDGEAHAQTFQVECQAKLLNHPTVGMGHSRRKAEQQAALLALREIGIHE